MPKRGNQSEESDEETNNEQSKQGKAKHQASRHRSKVKRTDSSDRSESDSDIERNAGTKITQKEYYSDDDQVSLSNNKSNVCNMKLRSQSNTNNNAKVDEIKKQDKLPAPVDLVGKSTKSTLDPEAVDPNKTTKDKTPDQNKTKFKSDKLLEAITGKKHVVSDKKQLDKKFPSGLQDDGVYVEVTRDSEASTSSSEDGSDEGGERSDLDEYNESERVVVEMNRTFTDEDETPMDDDDHDYRRCPRSRENTPEKRPKRERKDRADEKRNLKIMKKNPGLVKYIEKCLKEEKKAKDKKIHKTKKGKPSSQTKASYVRDDNLTKVKSPSDTTIYAPAIKLVGNNSVLNDPRINEQMVNEGIRQIRLQEARRILDFAGKKQREREIPNERQHTDTSDDEEPEEQAKQQKSKRGEMTAKEFSEEAVIQAEKYKASLLQPQKGTDFAHFPFYSRSHDDDDDDFFLHDLSC